MSEPVHQIFAVAIITSWCPNSVFRVVSVANYLIPSSRRLALQYVKGDPTQMAQHVKFECPYSHSLVHYRTFAMSSLGPAFCKGNVCVLFATRRNAFVATVNRSVYLENGSLISCGETGS